MTDYELTRRDALAALATVGASAAGIVAWDRLDEDPPLTDRDRRTVVAVARTVYPSEVSGVESFVTDYLAGVASERPAHARGIADAVAALDEQARAIDGAPYVDLSAERRDELLRGFGVATADPVPEGKPRERVRYYLVNELQYALYSSPTGGELVGLENPQGHPGGTRSYQRPPDGEE